MIWDFFARRICLTTNPDEWAMGEREFARVGLSVEKYQSIPDINPRHSFSRSEKQILADFYDSGAETLLHLEDDCSFKDLDHLPQALRELPSDWDIVYLGCNIHGEVVRHSEYLFRVKGAWTTHAIGYNRKVVPFILENQPGFGEMYDDFLRSQLPNLNAYVVAPMIAWQRPHYSDLWDREVDHGDVFQASKEKLETSSEQY